MARARTLTVLPRLDGDRKARVVQFLYEAGLITRNHAVLELAGGDLSEAKLSNAYLIGADLSHAHLNGADLRYTKGFHVTLRSASLIGADLSHAYLYEAVLSTANLRGANLSGSYLSGADLSGAKGLTADQLDQAKFLDGATMPDGTILKDVSHPNRPTLKEWRKSREGAEENSGP